MAIRAAAMVVAAPSVQLYVVVLSSRALARTTMGAQRTVRFFIDFVYVNVFSIDLSLCLQAVHWASKVACGSPVSLFGVGGRLTALQGGSDSQKDELIALPLHQRYSRSLVPVTANGGWRAAGRFPGCSQATPLPDCQHQRRLDARRRRFAATVSTADGQWAFASGVGTM